MSDITLTSGDQELTIETVIREVSGAPAAHATTHEDGGSDEITAQDLGSGAAALGKIMKADGAGGWTLGDTGGTPDPHAASHQNGGSDEISVAGLSGELADPQPVKTHDLAGADHNSATLAQLNAKVSDATLDDSGDARTPTAHASTHNDGGTDELAAQSLGSGAAVVNKIMETDGTGGWTLIDTPSGGGVPGGSDTQMQYNNAGAFGGTSGLTWDGTTLAGSNAVDFSNPATSVNTERFGAGALAQAVGSTAIGNSADADGVDAVALGRGASAGEDNSIAIGPDASTGGLCTSAIAIGDGAAVGASSANSIAIGAASSSTGDDSVVIGQGADDNGDIDNVILGQGASCAGDSCVVIGNAALHSDVTGGNAVAIGKDSSTSRNSTAIGYNADARGTDDVVIGRNAASAVSQARSIIIGSAASGSSADAVAIGRQATAGNQSLAISTTANATQQATVAIGYSSTCSAAGSLGNVAIGNSTLIGTNITGAVAIGRSATVNNDDTGSVVVGDQSSTGDIRQVIIGSMANGGAHDRAMCMGYLSATTTDDTLTIGLVGAATPGLGLKDLQVSRGFAAFGVSPPTTQPSKINDPSGGSTIDTEARTAIDAIIDVLEGAGLAASV